MLGTVLERLSEAPAVALLGARQVGKTSLAAQVARAWQGPATIFDLESPATREALSAAPERLLRSCEGLVILDEVQRMPPLFELLWPICDAPDRKAVFLLLGSASWDLVQGVSETLAGRILFVDMGGFSMVEVGAGQQDKLWLRGGFPRAWLAPSTPAWRRWMEAFARTYLERDLPGLDAKVAPEALGRFWRMLAHCHGQTWNATELARSVDVGVRAVNRYRDLLAGSFMLRVLPPWFENLGKRLVKSPKIYLRDSGILHFLLEIDSLQALYLHPRHGASWEGFALEQVLAVFGGRQAYFYGTQRGAELDLLLLRRGVRWGFEFKCADAPRPTKSMRVAIEDLGLEHLWVVYPGEIEYPLADKITVLPLRKIGCIRLSP